MLRRIIYVFAVVCFAANISFSQNKDEKVSTQTDKQKVTVVIPSAIVDEKTNLIEGKVSLVYDGDTISVTTKDGKIYSIWLKSIDAPESKQNYAKKSRKMLAELIEGKDVKVIIYKKDMYDRYIGTVYYEGQDVGLRQIEAGMAWHFKQFAYEQNAEERKIYAQAEQKARIDKQGLWEDSRPVAPWDYRSGKKTKDTNANETAATVENTSNTTTSETTTSKNNPSNKAERTYILGPRGGCYYVSESGRKVYVKDKSLCVKQ